MVAREPQNLHGPSLLSQCIQDAPQFPQSPLFALSLLRSYRESLSVTRAKPLVSSRRASYLAASFATTVCASKDLYLTAAVAANEHSWSPLFSTTTPAPPSDCSQDALASKIYPYYFDWFRLGAPAASPPGAPKHSGTCASSFPNSSSASPPSGQPLSCCLPWQPLHLSYRHRAAASCLSATVSSPTSCMTASVGVLLSVPCIILAALSWVCSSLSLLV